MENSPVQDALLALKQFFPERALALLKYLKKRNEIGKSFPTWREAQLEKLIGQLSINVDEMRAAYFAKRVMRLAWAVRNLLELSVWIRYCNHSQANAERFHKDAARDAIGWGNAIQAEFSKTGRGPHMDLDKSIKDLADRFLAGSIDDDFTKVVKAADEVGLRSEFVTKNKILSKYAHPTAWSIASVLEGAIKADEDVRRMFLSDGVELAIGSLTAIREAIIATLPLQGARPPREIAPE